MQNPIYFQADSTDYMK